MDATTLRYYDDELRHLRDVAWEFAQEHEKIGSRLALDRNGCGDPYVERLMEGFAFLAARIQRKLDDEFPSFTSHLLEMVYPDYLAPTPSMIVVALDPDPRAVNLADGYRVDRDTRLMSRLGASEETRCSFLTKHPVELWPIRLADARYITGSTLARHGVGGRRDVKAALHLRLETFGEVPFQQLALDHLPLYLTGSEGLGLRLYEAIIGDGIGVIVQPAAETPAWQHRLPRAAITTWGFEDELGLLPCSLRSFHGYRLLKEFFSFPERFLFARLSGLAPAIRRCDDHRLDLFVLLDSAIPALDGAVTAEQIALFATPAVNLFSKSAEPILINPHDRELHVVVDRTHDLDYEVHSLRRVRGFGDNLERNFVPFYEITDRRSGDQGFYTLGTTSARDLDPAAPAWGTALELPRQRGLRHPDRSIGTGDVGAAAPDRRCDVQQSRPAAAHAARRRPQPLRRRQRRTARQDHLHRRADPAPPSAGARPGFLAADQPLGAELSIDRR